MITKLTELESKLLTELIAGLMDGFGNGSFGLVEEIEWTDKKQMGGVLTSLQNKGYIESIDIATINEGEKFTQYTLNEDKIKAENLA